MRPGLESGTPVDSPSITGDSDDDDEDLPLTSFACEWKAPRKRKESTLKFADANFEKHVYGRKRNIIGSLSRISIRDQLNTEEPHLNGCRISLSLLKEWG